MSVMKVEDEIYLQLKEFASMQEDRLTEDSSLTELKQQTEMNKVKHAVNFYAEIFLNHSVEVQNNDLIAKLQQCEGPLNRIELIVDYIRAFGASQPNVAAALQESVRLYNRDLAASIFTGMLLLGSIAGGVAFGILCAHPLGAIGIIIAGVFLSALMVSFFSIGKSFGKSSAINNNILEPIRFFKQSKEQGVEFSAINTSAPPIKAV